MNQNSKRREALYHAKPTPGKIQVVPKEICNTKRFVLAYTPGVAEPCLEIAKMSIMYTTYS
jgi:malate dehydrogenase (oxaloacetate-decarboxylating)(NADP+)